MKISEIDKDFVNIVNYLDKMGFKPFSSCDGVLTNHTDPKSVTSAYIAFLKSPRIIDLVVAFFRDKEAFEITISSDTHIEPYYYLDNLIMGNKYMVSFSNKSGDLTSYFEKIITHVVEGKIIISDEEKKEFTTLSEILETDKDSDLGFSVSFNTSYQPYMNKEGQINVLRVTTKEGCGYYRNMHSLIDILYEKFGVIKKSDSAEETFEEGEFTVSSFDGSIAEIYFADEHIKDVQELIKKVRELGYTLPTFEVKDTDYQLEYDDIDYSDDEPVI